MPSFSDIQKTIIYELKLIEKEFQSLLPLFKNIKKDPFQNPRQYLLKFLSLSYSIMLYPKLPLRLLSNPFKNSSPTSSSCGFSVSLLPCSLLCRLILPCYFILFKVSFLLGPLPCNSP